jgi:fluoroquinolone transport system ATP-binding protein
MIQVQDLHFSYPGAQEKALSGVSFEVEQGEVFGFLGPSGAGKSTMQRILNKQLSADQGRVTYSGKALADWGREYFQEIGVSFELPNLFERLSGSANLLALAAFYKQPSRPPKELFELVGLSDALGKKVAEYSKGMKQRLVFLRAIQHAPKMLFLDEPTGGNDPGTTERIIEVIAAEKARGATVLLTTHDMHVAEALCDRIAFINEGQIVACDTPRNLKLKHGQSGVEVEYLSDERLQREVFDPKDAQQREKLAALLASGEVETLHSREASLGEIFIKLTGRGLV